MENNIKKILIKLMIILFVLSGIFVIYKTRFLFIDGKKKVM
ncbi:hypothetical protein [Clostridium sp.]